MTLKNLLLNGLFAGFLIVGFTGATVGQSKKLPGPRVDAPPPGQGQEAPQLPPAQVMAKHGKWQVQCTQVPAGQNDETSGQKNARQCGMLQSTSNPERKNITLTLVMGTSKQDDKTVTMMRILVPVGVYLPLGVALEIDGSPVGRVPFMRCLPQVCTAFAETTGETLNKMLKGAQANFIIYESPGVGVTLPISLSGFTAAYNDLIKL